MAFNLLNRCENAYKGYISAVTFNPPSHSFRQSKASATSLYVSLSAYLLKKPFCISRTFSFDAVLPRISAGRHLYCTVRLLTHVLCKPTHFFFHSFMADMSYFLQTNFSSVMKDRSDKYHVRVTPTRSPSRPNSR